MKVIERGITTEVDGACAEMIRWLLVHQADIDARESGTITVDYHAPPKPEPGGAAPGGNVQFSHLGRDRKTFFPKPAKEPT